MGLWIVVQTERLALAPVDEHGHHQHIAIHALCRNFVALNGAVFVLRAGGAPILLEALKGISSVLRRMLLPVFIVDPDAVGLGQIVLFDSRQESVYSRPTKEVAIPVPWPVRWHSSHQKPADNERHQQPSGTIKNHMAAPFASFVEYRSVEQGHSTVSSNTEYGKIGNRE